MRIFIFVSITLILCLSNVYFATERVNFGTVVKAESTTPNHLVQKGVGYYQAGEYKKAIEEWTTALKIYESDKKLSEKAIILGNLANAYEQIGDVEQTAEHWEQVVSLYRQLENPRETGRALTELAQSYSSLGQSKKAIEILCSANLSEKNEDKLKHKSKCLPQSSLQIARTQKDIKGEVTALGSLGEAYRQLANYDKAIENLEEAKKINYEGSNFLITNSLGNVYLRQAQLWNLRVESIDANSYSEKYNNFVNEAKEYYQKAYKSFQDSLHYAQKENNKSAQMGALINLINLYFRSDKINKTIHIFDENEVGIVTQQALKILYELPDSAQKVYAAVDLANNPDDSNITSPLTQCASKQQLPETEIIPLLDEAIKVGDNIENTRAKSFALGAKGHFYECKKDDNKALKLTQEALLFAEQKLKADDSLYLWEWQQARLLENKRELLEAKNAYERAFQTLEKIRRDILTADRDLQLDFRDVVQPLYRHLAQLKLENVEQKIGLSVKQKENTIVNTVNKELTEAREIIDSLRLAELQNYFSNECIVAATAITPEKIDKLLGDNTAIFTSIILKNRIAIILNLPNKKQYFEWIKENGQVMETGKFSNIIEDFRKGLIDASKGINYDTTQAANVYNLIIAPFESHLNTELNNNKIKTLIFIQDGFLRSIPMAALYDNKKKKYLIENYLIATTPSLKLTAPKKFRTETNNVLILALSKATNINGQEWRELSHVNTEIENVKKIFPNEKLLENEYFTLDNLKQELKKNVYPIIHIATHAQFGIIPEDTFLVAGNNTKITINDLEKALREFNRGVNSVELLSLTACQTAVGNDRTTLGLAGVALQAGVKSALASLWSVDDEYTSILVEYFYRNLREGKSKGQALQLAQKELLQDKNKAYSNPNFWASFILIGDWL